MLNGQQILLMFVIFSVSFLLLLMFFYVKRSNDNVNLIENIPFISPGVYGFLVRIGLIRASDLTKSFVNALHILKTSISKSDFKYALPWYLVVGNDSSGKTTILEHLNDMSLPGTDKESLKNAKCEWFLYTNGLAIEVLSSVFDLSSASKKINNNWQLIAHMLAYYRARKPLDGIVLTLSVDMFQKDESYPGANKAIAQNIFDNLWWLQSKLNIRLPIYIIITKCDKIDGFKDFMYNLYSDQKDQIFGWSSTYSLDEAYSQFWVDQAFNYITSNLKNSILKSAVTSQSAEGFNGMLFLSKNLNAIKEKLKSFTNILFGPYDRNEGLLLRGIYFTASELDKNNRYNEFDILNYEKATEDSETRRGTLNFVKDLFCEKIFMEYNIAKPIFKNFFFNRKTVLIRRFILLFFSFSLLIGFFLDYSRIKNEFGTVCNYIFDINTHIRKLKNLDSKDKSAVEKELKGTLSLISELKVENLKSVFIPFSWFNNFNHKIKTTISDSFDSAVINSLYADLYYKGSEINKPFQRNLAVNENIYADIFKTDEFKKLVEYVEKVLELQDAINQYNSLLERQDGEYLNSITNFLFDKQFNIDKFLQKKSRDSSKYPEFNFNMYAEVIKENINILFCNFVRTAFPNLFEKILQNIQLSINNMVNQIEDVDLNFSQNDILDVYKKISIVMKFLTDQKMDWMAESYFSPGKKYNDILNDISKIKIIDSEFLKQLVSFADESLVVFKNKLLKYKTYVTGPLLKRTKNILAIYPSQGFTRFYNDLGAILKEPFMINMSVHNMVTNVPETKLLYWNQDVLAHATSLIKSFNDFKNARLKTMYIQNQSIYSEIAKRVLRGALSSLVAKAQSFEEKLASNDRNIDSLIDNADNLRTVTSQLLTIVDFLESEFIASKNDLFVLVKTYYLSLLRELDSYYEKNQPFDIKFNVFSTWDGLQKANLYLLGSVASDEVVDYCRVQINSLKTMCKDVAEPLLKILNSKYLKRSDENNFVIEKWNNLLTFVDEYNAKKPGNSISLLENYFVDYLDKVNLENFSENDSLIKYQLITKDIFLLKRAKLATDLSNRVKELRNQSVIEKYNEIADYFNKNLSGMFPFVKFANLYTEDADIENVEIFLNKFDEIDDNVRNLLDKFKNFDKTGAINNALEFIKQIDVVKEFLRAVILSNKQRDHNKSKIMCEILFRTMPQEEVGGDQILRWEFSVGNQNLNSYDLKRNSAVWYAGDEIVSTFVWAKNSSESPYCDKNPILVVEGESASFHYKGKWAILRLINDAAFSGEAYPGNGTTLKFEIKTLDKSTGKHKRISKLFTKLRVYLDCGDKKTKYIQKLKFPTYAAKVNKILATKSEKLQKKNKD